jgi:hypothetical protein
MRNEILNHAIKAIEYRFRKVIAGSSNDFGNFKVSDHTRTPNEIINHMFDLAIKTKTMVSEGHFNSPPPALLEFPAEVERFLIGLEELQNTIAQKEIEITISKKLLQGPIVDMATHVGQIAMLNGLNGNKIVKESYYAAGLE